MYVLVTQVSVVTRQRIPRWWETHCAVRWSESASKAETLASFVSDGLLKLNMPKTDIISAHTSPFAFWMSLNGSSLHLGSNGEILSSDCHTFPGAAHLTRYLVRETSVMTHMQSFPLQYPASPSHCSFRSSYPRWATLTGFYLVFLPLRSVLVWPAYTSQT